MPLDYVQDGSITLNLSPGATGQLDLGNEWISLNARFGGVPREIFFPVGAVIAIFARENSAGMEFAYEATVQDAPSEPTVDIKVGPQAADSGSVDVEKTKASRPHLQRIK